jgi:hypothetical protein
MLYLNYFGVTALYILELRRGVRKSHEQGAHSNTRQFCVCVYSAFILRLVFVLA